MRYTHGSRVDGDTVVLVVDLGAGDMNSSAVANVEPISVMASIILITISVVDGHVGYSQAIAAVNTNGLHGGVLDVDVGDG